MEISCITMSIKFADIDTLFGHLADSFTETAHFTHNGASWLHNIVTSVYLLRKL